MGCQANLDKKKRYYYYYYQYYYYYSSRCGQSPRQFPTFPPRLPSLSFLQRGNKQKKIKRAWDVFFFFRYCIFLFVLRSFLPLANLRRNLECHSVVSFTFVSFSHSSQGSFVSLLCSVFHIKSVIISEELFFFFCLPFTFPAFPAPKAEKYKKRKRRKLAAYQDKIINQVFFSVSRERLRTHPLRRDEQLSQQMHNKHLTMPCSYGSLRVFRVCVCVCRPAQYFAARPYSQRVLRSLS